MSEASRARFAEVVRAEPVDLALACLLLGAEADPGLNPEPSLAELDRLAAAVTFDRPPVDALRTVLGDFRGNAADYEDLRSSLLHEVLRRRAGLPILLSVVWLEVARRAGLPACGVGLPGHFIARIGDEYVDPFAGGTPFDVGGIPAQYLRSPRGEEILLRILTNIRAWAGRAPGRTRVGLWAVELSLLLPHVPLDLRRDRGALLVASGDVLEGARELEAYADLTAATDQQAAEQARREARAARAALN